MNQQGAGPQQVQTAFDNRDQLGRIQPYVISGETLHAVYDCKGAGTGFVGVTDQRVIFYDQGVLSKKKQMVSIPYHRVIGVSYADEGGMIFKSAEITLLTAAGPFSFEFRAPEKATWVYRFVMHQILNQANPQLRG